MSDDCQEIKVAGVDKDGIEMNAGTHSLWGVPFQLSSKPYPDWERRFYEVQKSATNVTKRTMRIIGDKIKLDVSELDDLQKVLDVLMVVVAETNALCERDYQKKMKIRQELETLQRKQGDVTQKLKDGSDKLQF